MTMRPRALLLLIPVAAAALFAWLGFFFFRDNFSMHFAVKALSAEALRGGEIPWWSFHQGGGQPVAGNPNTLTFYPTTLLYVFLPAHVAFNLHFLLHLAGGWWAMRALTKSRWAATLYALSGVAISATAFYNLVTAVALIPLALVGVERKSARITGAAFGLMVLAAEPVMLIASAIAVAIVGLGRMKIASLAIAALLAAAIGAPQILAFSEIAPHVERAVGMSAETVLNTSLSPLRIAEIFTWPLSGYLNDAGGNRGRLFSTIFLGIIAVPALFRKSRYTLLAIVLLLLAIGSDNPLLKFAIETLPSLRVMRYPEKFALPLVVALVVLVADYFRRTRFKLLWTIATMLPLLYVAARTLPVDWYAPYRVEAGPQRRVHVTSILPAGRVPARVEYRLRAKRREPLFGALAGYRYAMQRSSDRMHSMLSRVVFNRWRANPHRYRSVALGPDARVIANAVAARNLDEAIALFERGHDVAPRAFVSAPARVTYRERGQSIELDVDGGPALVLVNQSYFPSWIARQNDTTLDTMPVDIDRLGVLVPKAGRVTLTFGRHRALIAATWLLSLLLLAATPLIEKVDRRAGEVERPADEH